MSGQTARAEVRFECVLRGLERKLEGPTVSLMERVLEEAGFDGIWNIKDSRRIRKKGRGRFSTIRLESRAGAKSIRMWCKPKGNDTGFEYSLYPPDDVDVDFAFAVLSRVHPVTLLVPESKALPGAVMDRILDIPVPVRPATKCVEVFEEPNAQDLDRTSEKDVPIDNDSEDAESWVSFDEEAIEPTNEDEEPALSVESGSDLWDREVADRALIALAAVAENGFARKGEASASIVRHLGIERFSNGGSDRYKTVQGSMRGIIMAMAKKWRYIERVKYSAEDGSGASDTVKGYKITAKGQRRLEAVRDSFGERARGLLGGLPFGSDREPPAKAMTLSEASEGVSTISIDAIKSMVERHEEANRQVKEHDEVLKAMDSDFRSMGIELEGLEAVEEDRRRRVAELQLELQEIESKKSSLLDRVNKKKEERGQWVDMRAPYALERDRIEEALLRGGRAG